MHNRSVFPSVVSNSHYIMSHVGHVIFAFDSVHTSDRVKLRWARRSSETNSVVRVAEIDSFSRYKIFGREKFLIYVADACGIYVPFNAVSRKRSNFDCAFLALSFLRILVADVRQYFSTYARSSTSSMIRDVCRVEFRNRN